MAVTRHPVMSDEIEDLCPRRKIFSNGAIMDNIYSWGLSHADITSCMTLCESGFITAAKARCVNAPEELPILLIEAGCSLVSFSFASMLLCWQRRRC